MNNPDDDIQMVEEFVQVPVEYMEQLLVEHRNNAAILAEMKVNMEKIVSYLNSFYQIILLLFQNEKIMKVIEENRRLEKGCEAIVRENAKMEKENAAMAKMIEETNEQDQTLDRTPSYEVKTQMLMRGGSQEDGE
jgi:hypothetical protein